MTRRHGAERPGAHARPPFLHVAPDPADGPADPVGPVDPAGGEDVAEPAVNWFEPAATRTVRSVRRPDPFEFAEPADDLRSPPETPGPAPYDRPEPPAQDRPAGPGDQDGEDGRQARAGRRRRCDPAALDPFAYPGPGPGLPAAPGPPATPAAPAAGAGPVRAGRHHAPGTPERADVPGAPAGSVVAFPVESPAESPVEPAAEDVRRDDGVGELFRHDPGDERREPHVRAAAPVPDGVAGPAGADDDEAAELGVTAAELAEADAWLRSDPAYDPDDEYDEPAADSGATPDDGPVGVPVARDGAPAGEARSRAAVRVLPDVGEPGLDDQDSGSGPEPRPVSRRATRESRTRKRRGSTRRAARPRGGDGGRTGVRSRLLLIGPVVAAVVGITVVGLLSNGAIGTEQPSAAATSTGESRESLPPRQVRGPSLEASTPLRVRLPSLGIGTRLVQLGLRPDGTVELPPADKPMAAGWYRYSPSPGEVGPSIVLGAVQSPTGGHGVFYRLGELHHGQHIEITRADGKVAVFTVKRVRAYPADRFPADDVYGHTDRATLRLITTSVPPTGTGAAAAREPHRNVVVYANLTGSHPTR